MTGVQTCAFRSKRVAWRQIYRWIQAQAAMIETGMAAAEEVFYPYLQVSATETVYERAITSGLERLALTDGKIGENKNGTTED